MILSRCNYGHQQYPLKYQIAELNLWWNHLTNRNSKLCILHKYIIAPFWQCVFGKTLYFPECLNNKFSQITKWSVTVFFRWVKYVMLICRNFLTQHNHFSLCQNSLVGCKILRFLPSNRKVTTKFPTNRSKLSA